MKKETLDAFDAMLNALSAFALEATCDRQRVLHAKIAELRDALEGERITKV